MNETYEKLIKRIMVLNERVWESRVPSVKIDQWLENFTGRVVDVDVERLHALFWLSQFMYFGSREVRVLLRSLYRDLYLCPMIQEVRSSLSLDTDLATLRAAVNQEVANTRFFGVGNPSESGVHLLYYFRQENRLSKKNFMDAVQIFTRGTGSDGKERRGLRKPSITRYVFLDDICGSGQTAVDYSGEILADLISLNPDASVAYYSMFATVEGLKNVRSKTLFGERCGAVYELDESYRCVSPASRYFTTKEYPDIDPALACRIAREYGEFIGFNAQNACGYSDSQMLMGFHHNTPDNTLPIIWADDTVHGGNKWFPVFKRYPKFLGADE